MWSLWELMCLFHRKNIRQRRITRFLAHIFQTGIQRKSQFDLIPVTSAKLTLLYQWKHNRQFHVLRKNINLSLVLDQCEIKSIAKYAFHALSKLHWKVLKWLGIDNAPVEYCYSRGNSTCATDADYIQIK